MLVDKTVKKNFPRIFMKKVATEGNTFLLFHQVPFAQKVDSAIHWINHNPLDFTISFPNTYPMDSNLSGPGCSKVGERYPLYKSLFQWVTPLVSLILICWLVIYPVDSAI